VQQVVEDVGEGVGAIVDDVGKVHLRLLLAQ
jgi:hypothetical protein